jgi:acetate kinase
MAAIKDGSSLDTTMGFTPAGGFMMGTRSGDLDPGIICYLLNERHFDEHGLAELVNHQSGLPGVSGISSDMKTLLERKDTEPDAAMAVQMFCYQLRKQIGALTAALGGLDLLVFTGGIGERAAPVRWEACGGLEHVGVKLDRERNDANADTISTADSRLVLGLNVVWADASAFIGSSTRAGDPSGRPSAVTSFARSYLYQRSMRHRSRTDRARRSPSLKIAPPNRNRCRAT